tara:strand:- start:48 stop:380 length:333 start_codon:yes stop_codon:yes gene_type:complete
MDELKTGTVYLIDLLKKFDNDINDFNNDVREYNNIKKEVTLLYNKVDQNINNIQQEHTLRRGSELLSEKIEFYNGWIKYMYSIHRITLVILGIIVMISLVYKIINKKYKI